mmetsp:Transcript_247/g.754  ORF Transcript_247/g.754 Transcript_247/m.754 type:complete len:221 (-) Transcript_247:440-1102(-)
MLSARRWARTRGGKTRTARRHCRHGGRRAARPGAAAAAAAATETPLANGAALAAWMPPRPSQRATWHRCSLRRPRHRVARQRRAVQRSTVRPVPWRAKTASGCGCAADRLPGTWRPRTARRTCFLLPFALLGMWCGSLARWCLWVSTRIPGGPGLAPQGSGELLAPPRGQSCRARMQLPGPSPALMAEHSLIGSKTAARRVTQSLACLPPLRPPWARPRG